MRVDSMEAEGVELCLFGDDGSEVRVPMVEVDAFCWHVFLPRVGVGQRFRVHGPWDPAQGHRCNASKLLLDPYAKAIEGAVDWHPSCFPYYLGDRGRRNDDDSAAHVPKGGRREPVLRLGRRPDARRAAARIGDL